MKQPSSEETTRIRFTETVLQLRSTGCLPRTTGTGGITNEQHLDEKQQYIDFDSRHAYIGNGQC
jgi:hypothetical protein